MAKNGLRKKIAAFVLGGFVVFLVGVAIFVYVAPTGQAKLQPAEFSPLRDDELARKFLPVFDCPPEFGAIIAVYYRAAIDASGLVHIAYHPVWSHERNDAPGFAPFLSRSLYTGGLSLQRLMFGKGDVESVALTIDLSRGSVLAIEYERAKEYDPSAFSVTHESVEERGDFEIPIVFEVMSWNHLFRRLQTAKEINSSISVEYFTSALWEEYGMQKNPPTRIQKDRAHFAWERSAAFN